MVTLVNNVQDKAVRSICLGFDDAPENLIEILHAVQRRSGYLSDDTLRTIADALNISRAEIHGVVSFYHDFKRKSPVQTTIKVCRAEACQAVGANALLESIEREYGLMPGQSSENLEIEAVYCLGNCALGPSIMIEGELYGRASIDQLNEVLQEARA